jgi:hypothetical protein
MTFGDMLCTLVLRMCTTCSNHIIIGDLTTRIIRYQLVYWLHDRNRKDGCKISNETSSVSARGTASRVGCLKCPRPHVEKDCEAWSRTVNESFCFVLGSPRWPSTSLVNPHLPPHNLRGQTSSVSTVKPLHAVWLISRPGIRTLCKHVLAMTECSWRKKCPRTSSVKIITTMTFKTAVYCAVSKGRGLCHRTVSIAVCTKRIGLNKSSRER